MRWEVVWAGETKPRSRKKGDWGHVALVLAVLAADAHAQIRTPLSDSLARVFRSETHRKMQQKIERPMRPGHHCFLYTGCKNKPTARSHSTCCNW